MKKVLIIKSMKVEEIEVEEDFNNKDLVRFWHGPNFRDIVIPQKEGSVLNWIVGAYNYQVYELEICNISNKHLMDALDKINKAGFWARLKMLFFGVSR